jgi:signal recognition particle GTPase
LNALKGDGEKHGIMDKTTKNGYEPAYVADQAVLAAENGSQSIVLADWKGRLAIALHYWVPSLLTWYLSRNAKKS